MGFVRQSEHVAYELKVFCLPIWTRLRSRCTGAISIQRACLLEIYGPQLPRITRLEGLGLYS